MQLIRDLASIISRKRINVLNTEDDREHQLLDLIRSEKTSKEELTEFFYPGSKFGRRNFNRLKRSLRDRLVNTVFAGSPKGDKEYREIYLRTVKQAYASELLWNKGKSESAATLANEAITTAQWHQFHDLTYKLSRLLADHYAAIVPNLKNFERFERIFERIQFKLKWEKRAESYYYRLALQLRSSKTIPIALKEEAARYIEELDPIEEVSWEFVYYRMNIQLIGCKMSNDIAGLIQVCEKALYYFDLLDFKLPNRPVRSVHLNLIPAYIHAHDYTKALEAIRTVKFLLPATSYNWIAIHQYEASVGFHLNQFDISAEALRIIKKSPLAKNIRDEIRVYETYLAFLQERPIRMSTFLNDTPGFSADKKGMNINRLILQILILLSKNDRAKIIDRAEALNKYAYRYLVHDETTRRSQLFMRLLFLTVRHSFDWPTIQKQTAKTYAELQSTPRHLSTIDIEVVPYEVLWGKGGGVLGGGGRHSE